MFVKSAALACLLALASTASAEADSPKIYFPRHIKRQYGNSTALKTFDPTLTETTDRSSFSTSSSLSVPSSLFSLPSSHASSPPLSSAVLSDSSTSSSSSTKRDGGVKGLLSEILPGDKSTGSEVTTVVISHYIYATPTSSSSSDQGILIGPTGVISTAATSKSSTSSTSSTAAKATSSSGNALDTLLGDLLPVSSTSTVATGNSTAASTSSLSDSTVTSSASSSDASATALLPTLSSILPLLSETTSTASGSNSSGLVSSSSSPLSILGSSTSSSTATSVASTSNSSGLLPTLSLPLGSTTPTTGLPSSTSQSTTITGTVVPANTTSSTSVSISNVVPTTSIPTSVTSNSTQETLVSSSAVLPTSASSGSSHATPGNSTTAVPVVHSSTASPTLTTHSSAHPHVVTETPTLEHVTSIEPTATLTNSNDWLPTQMIVDQTSISFTPPTSTNTASAATIPSDVPQQILPGSPEQAVPSGTVPIQLGFKYPLNWLFVAQNTTAASEIFTYLPQGLADAGNFDVSNIVINKLVPLNTYDEWGYITTLVKLDYPENMVETLQTQLWSPNSALYHNDNMIVQNLTNVLNPQIDIYGDDSTSSGSSGSSTQDSSSPNNAFSSNGSGDQTSKQKGTTAGIAVGAFSVSVMYGAAMFIVARRYKRKKQSHRRVNSVTSSQASNEMGYAGGSPPLIGGALMSPDMARGYSAIPGGRHSHGSGHSGGGNSARTANISAPFAAENSLGWN